MVEPDQLLPAALELAATICAGAPLAIRAARDILRATAGLEVAEGYRRLRDTSIASYGAMLRSEDALEGPRAFAEGRSPRWFGR